MATKEEENGGAGGPSGDATRSEEARAEVKRLLGETCAVAPATIRDEARLIEYGLDSVRAMDLVIALEERFLISIPDADAAKLKTVADLQAYVAMRTAPPAGPGEALRPGSGQARA